MDRRKIPHESHIKDYWYIVRRRKWLVLTFFSLVLLTVIVGTRYQTPIYKATVAVLIEPENPKILSIQEVLPLEMSAKLQYDYYYETQYNIIRSRAIAEKVVKKLGWLEEQEPSAEEEDFLKNLLTWVFNKIWAIKRSLASFFKGEEASVDTNISPEELLLLQFAQMFQASVVVEPVPNSRLVNISVLSPYPKEATRAANILAKVYIENNLDIKLETTKQAVAWLSKRLREQKEKVEKSEMALHKYKEDKGIISFEDDKENIITPKLVELNSKYTQTKIERIDMESLLSEMESLSKGNGRIESLPNVIENTLIRSLKDKYIASKAELTELSKLYKPKHPKILQLKAETGQLKRSMDEEINKITSSIRAEYSILLTKEKSLEKALAKQKAEALNLNKEEIPYLVLKRETDTNNTIYDMLLNRLKETSLEAGLETNNIRIVDEAEIPTDPISPNITLNILLGILTGLGGGVGLAFFLDYLDRAIRRPEDVDHYLKLPLLAVIPKFKRDYLLNPPYNVVTFTHPSSLPAQAYRKLRAKILFFLSGKGPISILISSSTPEEGKSTCVANLGVTLAQYGKKTLLVDADFHRPTLNRIFFLNKSPGLTELLQGESEIKETIQKTRIPNLEIITSGSKPPYPSEILGSPEMQMLVHYLKNIYDITTVRL